MTDFPATHSMDTLWFAVDRDGDVAVFDSGESGLGSRMFGFEGREDEYGEWAGELPEEEQ